MLAARGLATRPRARVDTAQTVLEMVRAEVGIGVLNAVAVEQVDTSDVCVLDLDDPDMIREVAVYWYDVLLETLLGKALHRALLAAPAPSGGVALDGADQAAEPRRGGPVRRARHPAPVAAVGSASPIRYAVAPCPIRHSADRRTPWPRSSAASPSWRCCGRGSPRRSRGQPQVVQIEGPAGIGKTALVEHFLADDRRRARRGAGQRRGDRGAARLRRGGTAGAIGGSRPVRLARWPALAARAGPGPGDGRAPRILDLLDGLDDDRPVVLVIDDAHWADLPSLQALIFALRRLVADPVLTLLVVRERRSAGAAGERAPAGQRASRQHAAAARARRGGPSRPRRGAGHR